LLFPSDLLESRLRTSAFALAACSCSEDEAAAVARDALKHRLTRTTRHVEDLFLKQQVMFVQEANYEAIGASNVART
jgi:hypothetical protein